MRIAAGTSSEHYEPGETVYGTNLDDFDVQQLALLLPDGTEIDGIAEWFDFLDTAGAASMTHSEIVKLLARDHEWRVQHRGGAESAAGGGPGSGPGIWPGV